MVKNKSLTEANSPVYDAEVVPVPSDSATVTIGGRTFRRDPIKLPRWKFEFDEPKYMRIITPARKEAPSRNPKPGDESRQPATTCMVEDLTTGNTYEIVLGTVLLNLLTERFPGDAYVGKSFEVTMIEIPGKAWHGYSLNLLVS